MVGVPYNPDSTKHTHLDDKCSYVGYVEGKIYEYYAMAEMLAILAGIEGGEKQKQAFEALKLSFEESAQGGLLSVVPRQMSIGEDLDRSMALNSLAAFKEWFGDKKGAEEADANAEALRQRAETSAKQNAEILKKEALELWDEFKRRWHECGLVYAVTTFSADTALELAIGKGLSAGAKKLLKKVGFDGKETGDAVTGIAKRKDMVPGPQGQPPQFEQPFKKEDLAKKYGQPKDNHAGVKTEDANRKIGEGGSPDKSAAPDKPKETPSERGTRYSETGKKGENWYREQNGGKGLQNDSGHGIDVYDKGPPPVFKEVKTSAHDSENPRYRLSGDQAEGGKEYVRNILNKITSQEDNWANATAEQIREAESLKSLLEDPSTQFKQVNVREQPDGSFKVVEEKDWVKQDKKQKDLRFRKK